MGFVPEINYLVSCILYLVIDSKIYRISFVISFAYETAYANEITNDIR